MNDLDWLLEVSEELIKNAKECGPNDTLVLSPARAMELGIRMSYFLQYFGEEDEV